MGIPRGSVLGPLLFLTYLSDVFNLKNNVRFGAYADDISILLARTDANKLISTVNVTLGSFAD